LISTNIAHIYDVKKSFVDSYKRFKIEAIRGQMQKESLFFFL